MSERCPHCDAEITASRYTCVYCGTKFCYYCPGEQSPEICEKCLHQMATFGTSRSDLMSDNLLPEPRDSVKLRKSSTSWDTYEVYKVDNGRALLRHHAGTALEWRGLANLRLIRREAFPKIGMTRVVREPSEGGWTDTLNRVRLEDEELLRIRLQDGNVLNGIPVKITATKKRVDYGHYDIGTAHMRSAYADCGVGKIELAQHSGITARRVSDLNEDVQDWSLQGA